MNADVYAEFLKTLGHKVIRTESAYWFDVYPRTFLAFPHHLAIQPSTNELKALFKSALMLRFVSISTGTDSYYIACDQKPYTLETLTSKARNQTRRGLENWRVDSVGCDWVASHGENLNAQTLARQGRNESEFDQNYWHRVCTAAAKYYGFEGWAAVANDRAAAVAITFVMDDVAYILLQRSGRADLGSYPNNALNFEMTRRLLARPNIRMVFYGLRPLAAGDSLDHFKAGMGYRQFSIKESFSVAPAFRPLIPAVRLAINTFPVIKTTGSGKKLASALKHLQD